MMDCRVRGNDGAGVVNVCILENTGGRARTTRDGTPVTCLPKQPSAGAFVGSCFGAAAVEVAAVGLGGFFAFLFGE